MAALASGCGEDGLALPTSPSSPSLSGTSLSGTWGGWFTSPSAGIRTATVTLFHVGPVVSGVWTIFDVEGSAAGVITGTVVGSTALLTLQPTDSDGCPQLIVARFWSTTLEGTWSTPDCETQSLGTFRLMRQ